MVDLAVPAISGDADQAFTRGVSDFPAWPLGRRKSGTSLMNIVRTFHDLPAGGFAFPATLHLFLRKCRDEVVG